MYRKHFSQKGDSISSIKSFVGDTIIFNTQSDYDLTNVYLQIPDTVWLKEKRPKKPKENKHYLLCHNYKGIQQKDKSFVTPASEVDSKPFVLLSVEEIFGGKFRITNVGYKLSLLDPQTNRVICVHLDKDLLSTWKFYSRNVNQQINSWENKIFYCKAVSRKDIDVLKFSDGIMYSTIEPTTNNVILSPYAQFNLTNDKTGERISLTYSGNGYLGDRLEKMEFLSQKEYDDDLEKKRVYTIDYEMPKDTTFNKYLSELSFTSIIGYGNKRNIKISQTIKPEADPLSDGIIVPALSLLFIADRISVRGTDYYKAALDGKAFFIKCSDVAFSNDDDKNNFERLMNEPQCVKDAFLDNAKAFSLYFYAAEAEKDAKERHNKLQAITNRGLVVLEAYPYDMGQYLNSTGMTFKIGNTSNKTIKYITFNAVGYNPVDDPIPNYGKYTVTGRGIGPIEPYTTASYDFDFTWFTDLVEYLKVKSIKVEYTNGTVRTYTGKAIETVSEEYLDSLTIEPKSVVSSLLPKFE
ncbi:MAG TPA: hypothetical protein DC009_07485 [Porphyromonadaceae bacterium]|nr:hypothetical protein [Porphyromonadaceae bacterium]